MMAGSVAPGEGMDKSPWFFTAMLAVALCGCAKEGGASLDDFQLPPSEGGGETAGGGGGPSGCPLGCGELPAGGKCEGNLLVECSGGLALCTDCSVIGRKCAVDAVKGGAACRTLDFRNPPCVPQCAGKACGPDACGGSCGFCPEGAVCDGTTCRDEGGPCGEVGGAGACFLDVLATCQGGKLSFVDCDGLGRVCAMSDVSGQVECLFP
jgi:hypothetical protein